MNGLERRVKSLCRSFSPAGSKRMNLNLKKFFVIAIVLVAEVSFALLTLYAPGTWKLLFLVLMILNTVFVNKTVVLLRKLFRIPANKDAKY